MRLSLIVSTLFVAGCGGGGNEVEKMEFKPTDTTQMKGMLDQQAKGLKGCENGGALDSRRGPCYQPAGMLLLSDNDQCRLRGHDGSVPVPACHRGRFFGACCCWVRMVSGGRMAGPGWCSCWAKRQIKSGQIAAARERLARLSRWWPRHGEVEYLLGNCESELGRTDSALNA